MATDENDNDKGLIRMDDEAQLIRTDPNTLSALNRSEVEAQLDAAHRYPRNLTRFQKEAITLATAMPEVAKSCMYTLERKDKNGKKIQIVGPSIRLAEICASSYQNLHAGARPVDVGDTTVTSQGICWDVEKNVRVVTETKRRITGSNGRRYGEDMIIMTQNAASSIALRNAIFRVIPRSLIDVIFERVKLVATGGAKPMEQKRQEIVAAYGRLGIVVDRMLAKVERENVADLTLEDIEALIGYGTRINQGEDRNELFPITAATSVVPGEQGKREPMRRPEQKQEVAAKPAETKTAAPKSTEDPDAEARAAAAPTAEEIAKMDQGRTPGSDDEEVPPWAK